MNNASQRQESKSRQELKEVLKKKGDESFNDWANRFIRASIAESGSNSDVEKYGRNAQDVVAGIFLNAMDDAKKQAIDNNQISDFAKALKEECNKVLEENDKAGLAMDNVDLYSHLNYLNEYYDNSSTLGKYKKTGLSVLGDLKTQADLASTSSIRHKVEPLKDYDYSPPTSNPTLQTEGSNYEEEIDDIDDIDDNTLDFNDDIIDFANMDEEEMMDYLNDQIDIIEEEQDDLRDELDDRLKDINDDLLDNDFNRPNNITPGNNDKLLETNDVNPLDDEQNRTTNRGTNDPPAAYSDMGMGMVDENINIPNANDNPMPNENNEGGSSRNEYLAQSMNMPTPQQPIVNNNSEGMEQQGGQPLVMVNSNPIKNL